MNRVIIESDRVAPSKIVCVGRNYLEHIKELGNEEPSEMVIFNKPNSSISPVLHAFSDGEALHYEAEICFMVYAGNLYGVGFGLDLTRRDLQSVLKKKGLPWERAKGFNGACCLSEFVSLDKIDLTRLTLKLEINGHLRQQGGYELMIHKPEQIVAGIERFMQLEDHDIIMTGTPKGVGKVQIGDEFVGNIFAGDQVLISQRWRAQ